MHTSIKRGEDTKGRTCSISINFPSLDKWVCNLLINPGLFAIAIFIFLDPYNVHHT